MDKVNKVNKVKLSVLLPAPMRDYLLETSGRTGLSMSAMVYMIIDQYITGKTVMEKLPQMLDTLNKVAKAQKAIKKEKT